MAQDVALSDDAAVGIFSSPKRRRNVLIGAGDRDRTGDIQLGKVAISFIYSYLQNPKSTKMDANGIKGILTAGVNEGFRQC